MERSVSFHRDWQFWEDPNCGLALPAGEVPWRPVDLPHDWQIWHAGDLYRDGVGWYQKRFHLDPEPGKRYQLFFDGVYMDAAVFLNGLQVGEWKYGYSAFRVDLTQALRQGENTLLVRCHLRHPNSRWYSGAGIYRSVRLGVLPELHLIPDGLYLSAKEGEGDRWTVKAQAEVGGKAPLDLAGCALTFVLLDPAGNRLEEQTVSAGETSPVDPELAAGYLVGEDLSRTASVIFSLEHPEKWDLERPVRYRVEVSLTRDGQLVDRQESWFGCRTVEMTPDRGLFLNHRHLQIHGVCTHHDLGCLGSAFYEDAARRQLALLREMGTNSIRTGHGMPARELMDLADQMGFLINSESFDCWERGKNQYDYGRFFQDWHRKDVASWIRRDRNHPSLLFWSVGNEIYDTHAGPRGMEILRELLRLVALHDPEGNGTPTFGSNYLPWENTQKCAGLIKVVGYNYGERCYEAHHRAHPDWIIYGSETASIVQSRGIYHFPLSQSLLVDDDQQCSSLGNSRTSWGAASLDACFQADRQHPYSLGQYLWTGIDYIGEPTPYHTRNSYFGMIDTAGFPKDGFYACQAAWRDGAERPMVHLFPYWDFNPGQIIDVCAVSNAHSVELWVNGVSQGRKVLDPDVGVLTSWQVPYQPGRVEVAAYDAAGREVARDSQSSFGDCAALSLTADKTALGADGGSLAFLTISARDGAGRPVANANCRVQVQVEGEGVLLGLDNGDSTDTDEYKTDSRRLFSGLLLAVVAGTGKAGKMKITVTAPGLAPASLELETVENGREPTRHRPVHPSASAAEDIPVRKICLEADRRVLTPEQPEAVFTAKLFPENAAYRDLEWRAADDGGVTVPNVQLEVLDEEGRQVRVRGLGDGRVRVRCTCKNGKAHPQLISQLELEVTGMGQMNPDPYTFLTGSLYDQSDGEVGNGNERGVSTSRTGMSWVAYENLDFGRDGSDVVELPIFELAGEPTPIRFWRGIPYAPGSRMIGERIYHKPKIWNVYQPETFQLEEKLTGIQTFGIELHSKVHIKGFQFQRQSRAWDKLRALDCDMVYGDTFTRTETAVCGIGNNVSLVYQEMDFGAEGCTGITIRGRSDLENNTIHLCFQGEGESQRRILEFACQPEWGERTFYFEGVTGRQQVTFLFLPGCQFDFESFQFQ